MKRITTFAAAVVLVTAFAWASVPGVGVSADNDSGVELPIIPVTDDSGSSSTPDDDSSSNSEIGGNDSSESDDSSSKPDTENPAQKVNYTITASIKLINGSEIDTDIVLDESDAQSEKKFSKTVTKEEIESILKANSKTLDDFAKFVFYVSTDFPENQGLKDTYVVDGLSFEFSANPVYKEGIDGTYVTFDSYDASELTVKGDKVLNFDTSELSWFTYDVTTETEHSTHHVTFNEITGFDLTVNLDTHNAVVHDRNDDTKPETLIGDLNGDGSVNITDIAKLAAHIKGKRFLPDTSIADFNKDNKINVSDLTKLAAHIKGKKLLS